ncbi:hypothetical protein SKAU_G00324530 [Synaphobranchus kaupii]|uniref:Uncharacterized protein n=1 Tax=Synaphobranchus kaupii TaxID=118154 RepID=A0A9Q1IJ60_SYNKA|nr:hypothetical protein SKAU_G00324530 [Synaphobranchus kaupii]
MLKLCKPLTGYGARGKIEPETVNLANKFSRAKGAVCFLFRFCSLCLDLTFDPRNGGKRSAAPVKKNRGPRATPWLPRCGSEGRVARGHWLALKCRPASRRKISWKKSFCGSK